MLYVVCIHPCVSRRRYYISCLAVQGILFFLLLFLIESGILRQMFGSLLRKAQYSSLDLTEKSGFVLFFVCLCLYMYRFNIVLRYIFSIVNIFVFNIHTLYKDINSLEIFSKVIYGENRSPEVTDNLYHIMLNWVHLAWARFELTILVVIATDYLGSCKSNTIPFL
jgi:hypothetical protein